MACFLAIRQLILDSAVLKLVTFGCQTDARIPTGDMQFRSRLLDFQGVVHLVPDHVDGPPKTLPRCAGVGTALAANLDSPGRLLSIHDAHTYTPARRAAAKPVSDFSEFSSALSQTAPPSTSLLPNRSLALVLAEERSCGVRW